MDKDTKIRLMQAQKFESTEDFFPKHERWDRGSRSEVRWQYFQDHFIPCCAEAALRVLRHTGWDQPILTKTGTLSRVDRGRVVFFLAMTYGGNRSQIESYIPDICLQIEVWFPDGVFTRARAEELKI